MTRMDPNGVICKNVETVVSHVPQAPPSSAGAPVAPAKSAGLQIGPLLRGRRRTALIVSIGGAVFSAIGFIGLALFEQYNDSLAELRHDLKHFNENSGDLVKKESLRRYRDQLKKCSQEVREAREAQLLMNSERTASEAARKEAARELQLIRERLAAVEGRQAATAIPVPMPPAER
jgi:hypothetical protein